MLKQQDHYYYIYCYIHGSHPHNQSLAAVLFRHNSVYPRRFLYDSRL